MSIFPGLPWSPSGESVFDRIDDVALEDHLLVDPYADQISRAHKYSYQITVAASSDGETWTDITSTVNSIGPIWWGLISDNVYGWSFQLSGRSYDDTILAPGCYVKLGRTINITGYATYIDPWMKGIIIPSPIQFSYLSAAWSIQVVDEVTYLSRKKAEMFFVGGSSAITISTQADSSVDSSVVLSEGEFYGAPELTDDKAVDGDLGTLWISAKESSSSSKYSYLPYEDQYRRITIILNEAFTDGFSTSRLAKDQWFEIVTPSNMTDARQVRLLTRYGGVQIDNVSFGRPSGLLGAYEPGGNHLNDLVAHYAVLTYDADYYRDSWGEQNDVPVHEWKNSNNNWEGATLPGSFGFNLDGQGDFLAISGDGDCVDSPWNVYLVVGGPKMERFDKGTFLNDVNGNPCVVECTKQWTTNALAGAFIKDLDNHYRNRCRRITSNTAGVWNGSGYTTRIVVDFNWNNFDDRETRPRAGDTMAIRPWPMFESISGSWMEDYGNEWITGNYDNVSYSSADMLTDLPKGSSYRKIYDGWYKSWVWGSDPPDWEWVDKGVTWEIDVSPQPGPSFSYGEDPGVPNTPEMDQRFPWLIVSPDPFLVVTSAPISNGDTVIHTLGTNGLLPATSTSTKRILVGGTVTPVYYSDKDASDITLVSAWNQGTIPVSTAIKQYDGGVATDLWPIKTLVIKRRKVASGTSFRLIKKANVFLSFQTSPKTPEDDDWRTSWASASSPANPYGSPVFSINDNYSHDILPCEFGSTWFTGGYSRFNHALISIIKMTDDSRGRINEVEFIPAPGAVYASDVTSLADFFDTVLSEMGIDASKIDVTQASTRYPGSFSTDTSSYLDVLSDLCYRTGHILWSGPNLQARVVRHPNWPAAPIMDTWMTLDNDSVARLDYMPYTGYPISQLQVNIKDYGGDTVLGVYPPSPLDEGDIVVEPGTITAELAMANSIARMLYNEKSSHKLRAEISGPAPWARPGPYRVNLNYTLPDGSSITGPYYISGIEHTINLGADHLSERSWVSTLELTKLFNAS